MARVWGMVISLLGFTLMLLLVVAFQAQMLEVDRVRSETEHFLMDVCREAVLMERDVSELRETLREYEVETCVLRRLGRNVRLREFDATGWDKELYVGDEVVVRCTRQRPSLLVRFLYATGLKPEGLLATELVLEGMVFGEGGY